MPERIAEYARETGQKIPTTPGAISRCILESLALLYRRSISELESLTGNPINRLHIVGGGTRNELLNQAAANATGLRIITGPVEATAAGNILIQAITAGDITSLSEARKIVADSFSQHLFEPQDSILWGAAYARFVSLP